MENLKEKLCRDCASVMPKDAKKCLECGAYDDFRRYFESSETTIALIIAALSVFTIFVDKIFPIIDSYTETENERITLDIMMSSIDTVKLFIRNNTEESVILSNRLNCMFPISEIEAQTYSEKNPSTSIPSIEGFSSTRFLFSSNFSSMDLENLILSARESDVFELERDSVLITVEGSTGPLPPFRERCTLSEFGLSWTDQDPKTGIGSFRRVFGF